MAVNHKSSIDELVREIDADPLFPQFMDDSDPDEGEMAMWFNRVLLARLSSIFVIASHMSLTAAASEGKCPLVLMILRSW